MIQNVATENAHFVIYDQELSTEESPKEKQFRMDCFRYALRAIESDQLIFRVGTVKFEAYPGIRDGIIIRQYPLRGAPVTARDPISLVVSKQEETSIIEQPSAPQPVLTMTR